MTSSTQQPFRQLSEYLASRHDAILARSRAAESHDPEQTTVRSLTHAQFADHIPQVLAAFEDRLRAEHTGVRELEATRRRQAEEVKHGLHRWQQGYRLRELMHEWGHLHRCLFDEIESFASTHPDVDRAVATEAQRLLLGLISEAISESAGEYARLQQDEAAGVLADVQRTMNELKEMERRRAALIHEAVHDLRGNVQGVSTVAEVLRDPGIPEQERKLFVNLLQQGADSVGSMLGQLMDLARLEAGQEKCEIRSFDAAAMLMDFCKVTKPIADDRRLSLECNGPVSLLVESDSGKVRRIVQNLVLNALKYTSKGGVVLSWGEQSQSTWWVKIEDTGPGLALGPGAPIVRDMVDATDSARESERETESGAANHSGVIPAADGLPHPLPAAQARGEGIGLSIVKRLCELLDASIELASSKDSGTTFRVVLPRSYPSS